MDRIGRRLGWPALGFASFPFSARFAALYLFAGTRLWRRHACTCIIGSLGGKGLWPGLGSTFALILRAIKLSHRRFDLV